MIWRDCGGCGDVGNSQRRSRACASAWSRPSAQCESNREALAIEIGASVPSTRVIRVRERLMDQHGKSRLCESTMVRSSRL